MSQNQQNKIYQTFRTQISIAEHSTIENCIPYYAFGRISQGITVSSSGQEGHFKRVPNTRELVNESKQDGGHENMSFVSTGT